MSAPAGPSTEPAGWADLKAWMDKHSEVPADDPPRRLDSYYHSAEQLLFLAEDHVASQRHAQAYIFFRRWLKLCTNNIMRHAGHTTPQLQAKQQAMKTKFDDVMQKATRCRDSQRALMAAASSTATATPAPGAHSTSDPPPAPSGAAIPPDADAACGADGGGEDEHKVATTAGATAGAAAGATTSGLAGLMGADGAFGGPVGASPAPAPPPEMPPGMDARGLSESLAVLRLDGGAGGISTGGAGGAGSISAQASHAGGAGSAARNAGGRSAHVGGGSDMFASLDQLPPARRLSVMPAGTMLAHWLPVEFAQSTIDGRMGGSSACFIIAFLVARAHLLDRPTMGSQGAVQGRPALPAPGVGPACSPHWFEYLKACMRRGNAMYDAIQGGGRHFDFDDIQIYFDELMAMGADIRGLEVDEQLPVFLDAAPAREAEIAPERKLRNVLHRFAQSTVPVAAVWTIAGTSMPILGGEGGAFFVFDSHCHPHRGAGACVLTGGTDTDAASKVAAEMSHYHRVGQPDAAVGTLTTFKRLQ